MEHSVFHKETPLFVNVHKDSRDSVVRIKCKPIHVNQIHVKMEAFVQAKAVEHMVWLGE